MSEHLYLLTLFLMLGTPVLIFAMKYVSAAVQAVSRLKSETAYRELAEKAVTAQSESAASLASIRSELAKVTTSLTAIEKILKDVE